MFIGNGKLNLIPKILKHAIPSFLIIWKLIFERDPNSENKAGKFSVSSIRYTGCLTVLDWEAKFSAKNNYVEIWAILYTSANYTLLPSSSQTNNKNWKNKIL